MTTPTSGVMTPTLHHHNTDTVSEIELHMRSRGLLNMLGGKTFATGLTAAPTPIKFADYAEVKDLQPALNSCLDNMSRDKEFIVSSLEKVAEQDAFCRGFLEIYKDLPTDHEDLTLGVFRHDFMYQTSQPRSATAHLDGQFKLVEFNLVAASMGCLTEGVSHYHRSVLNKAGLSGGEKIAEETRITDGFSEAIARAHYLYQEKYNARNCVVVLMDSEWEEPFNYFDQQMVLNGVEKLGVSTLRCSSTYLTEHGHLNGEGRFLIPRRTKKFTGEQDEDPYHEVSVFYLRTMYRPTHFPEPAYWTLRRDMEMSKAVCCPTIPHTIVNMKLYQMLLAQEEILARYTPTPDLVKEAFFATLSLELTEEGDRNAALALADPSQYVMKPQREGGGNNFWGEEMVEKLAELNTDSERGRFILMKKITPPVFINRFIKGGVEVGPLETVSEVGYYSVYLKDGKEEIYNRVVGPLVRTKDVGENEGGVAVGVSCIDSPYFV